MPNPYCIIMRQARTRKKGDKQPEGETKSKILLYLADHKDQPFNLLRGHLYKELKLQTPRAIRDHLEYFEKKGYVTKTHLMHGPSGTYYLNVYNLKMGFEGFKKIYTYLKDHHFDEDLIKTDYYKEYIQTVDFREKIRIHFFKENMLKIYRLIKEVDTSKLIEKSNNTSDMEAKKTIQAIEAIKKDDEDKPIIKELIELFKTVERNDVDQLYQIFKDRLKTSPDSTLYMPDPEKYLEVLTNMLIPLEQRDNFIKILEISPSAIDFILNSKYYDSNIIFFNLGAYFTPALTKDLGFLRKLFHYDIEQDVGINLDILLQAPIENVDLDLLTKKSKRHMKNLDSSFMFVLRALLISDIVEGKLIRNNIIQDSLKQIFSTNFSTNLWTNLSTKTKET